MDPETLRSLEESIRELNNVLDQQNTAMTGMTKILKDSTIAYGKNTSSLNVLGRSINNATGSIDADRRAREEAQRIQDEVDKNNNNVMQSAGNTLRSFGSALISSTQGLSKYGNSIELLGNASLSLGMNFGKLGAGIGLGILAFTKLTQSVLKVEDNIIQFRDGFAEAAGVMPITASELGEFAKQAGFSLDDMQKLAKVTANLGTNLLGLGEYAGKSAVKFLEIANVSDEERKRFSRLGISQEALLDYQAKYIEIQTASGNAAINRNKSAKQLRTDSLEYAEEMSRLQSLTGKRADQLQQAAKEVLEDPREISETLAVRKRIADLREKGDASSNQEADRLEKNLQDAKNAQTMAAGMFGAETGKQVGIMLRAGVTGETAGNMSAGDFEAVQRYYRSSRSKQDLMRLMQDLKINSEKFATNFNTTLQRTGDAAGFMKLFGQTAERFVTTNRMGVDIQKDWNKVQSDQYNKGKEGKDQLADTVADIQSIERNAKQLFQGLLESISPIRGLLNAFAFALTTATASLAIGSLGNLLGSGLGGGLGRIGRATGGLIRGATGGILRGAGGLIGGAGGMLTTGAAGLALGGAAVGMIGNYLGDKLKTSGYEKTGATVSIGSSVAAGAMMGSMLGPWGIALGAAAGGAYGLYKNWGTLTGGRNKAETGDTEQHIELLKGLAEQVQVLQRFKFDKEKVTTNAESVVQFTNVVASTLAMVTGKKVESSAEAIAMSAKAFFSMKLPKEEFIAFSKIELDPDKVKKNSEAFVNFANAMSTFKGGPGFLSVLSAGVGKVLSWVTGQDGPVEAFVDFTKQDFGPNASQNAEAFYKYAQSVSLINQSSAGAGAGAGGGGGGGASGVIQSGLQTGAKAGAAFVGAIGGALGAVGQGAVELGSKAFDLVTGGSGKEKGVKPEVLGRKAALEKIMGQKLVVSSGVREGSSHTSNHGDGSAIDLGFNSNPWLGADEKARNKLMANAINLGFTGIGAEYSASGGAHIHLDVKHPRLMAWGSDYTSKSLIKDSPWLYNYINRGKGGSPKQARDGGIFTSLDGSSLQMPKSQKLAGLNNESLLMQLAKTNVDVGKTVDPAANDTHQEINIELFNLIEHKLDHVLSALESSHHTQNKMLRHAIS